eukprot:m.348108 g.348108  ORF g.348108 m.348108 type:complete len:94 (-) comp35535_c0_seq1:40-321(-)
MTSNSNKHVFLCAKLPQHITLHGLVMATVSTRLRCVKPTSNTCVVSSQASAKSGWTQKWTSERCGAGTVVTGIQCDGSWCDHQKLSCRAITVA